MPRLLAVLALVVSVPAFAEEPPAPTPASANAERLFPQGISPVTNATLFHSNTSGRATNAGGGAFRVSERIDVAPIQRLTVSVGMEYRNSGDLNPELTAKYQFLDQTQPLGINGAAALKYKVVGFNPNGSEIEAILAASRSFGPLVVMLNGVFGAGLFDPDMDAEVALGVGMQVLGSGFVGLNGQAKFLVGNEAILAQARGERPSEFLGGAVVAYRFGFAEASLLGGYFSPVGNGVAGPMALGRIGLSF
jgi:hypothetical protein